MCHEKDDEDSAVIFEHVGLVYEAQGRLSVAEKHYTEVCGLLG